MKAFFILIFVLFLSSCNIVQWQHNRMTRKLDRKEVVEKSLDLGGHHIRYYEGGEGETVLLIHGFGGDALVTWYKTIKDLSKDYHVLAPDLLWFGESWSKGKPNLTTQIDAMAVLLKESGVEKCIVAGISYGGFVSLGLHFRDPELISKLCIIDSPGLTYNVDLLDTLSKTENVEGVEDIFVVRGPAGVQKLFDLAFYKDRKLPKGLRKQTYDLFFDKHHDELEHLIISLREDQMKYKEMQMPDFPETLIIWGEHDDVFPLSEGKKLAKFMGAELVVIPKAGHAPNIENYKKFERCLRGFINDNR